MYAFALTRHDGQMVGTFNYLSLFNAPTNSRTVVLLQAQVTVYAKGQTSVSTPLHLTRITEATLGSEVGAGSIAKFRSTDPDTVAQVRTGNPTVTLGADVWNFAPPYQVATPGAFAPTPQPADFPAHWDRFLLAPGEGVVFRQSDVGDSDQQFNFVTVWSEQS